VKELRGFRKIKKLLIVCTIIFFAVIISACSTEAQAISGESFTITLSVRTDTLIDNMNLLDREKHEIIPDNNIIFYEIVVVRDGDSVFDVLQREMRNAGIHMAFRNTPIINSVYIEAINNLYEFDAGALSGWKYSVNGRFPGVSASSYNLNPGDVVEWHYTLNLGRDLDGFGE